MLSTRGNVIVLSTRENAAIGVVTERVAGQCLYVADKADQVLESAEAIVRCWRVGSRTDSSATNLSWVYMIRCPAQHIRLHHAYECHRGGKQDHADGVTTRAPPGMRA